MNGLLLVMLGGAVGSVCRYLLARWVQAPLGAAFPWGTLAVNVLGCLVIGVLGGYSLVRPPGLSESQRQLLIIGGLGGFTTFSAFGWETLTLADTGRPGLALANVAANNVAGLAAAWIGLRAARLVWSGG